MNVLILLLSTSTTLAMKQLLPHFPIELLLWRKIDFGLDIRKSTPSLQTFESMDLGVRKCLFKSGCEPVACDQM